MLRQSILWFFFSVEFQIGNLVHLEMWRHFINICKFWATLRTCQNLFELDQAFKSDDCGDNFNEEYKPTFLWTKNFACIMEFIKWSFAKAVDTNKFKIQRNLESQKIKLKTLQYCHWGEVFWVVLFQR